MTIKNFFNLLLQCETQQKIEQKRSKIRGKVIQCHDCQKLGYLARISHSEYELSQGWKMAWVGLKPLYICHECSRKRIMDLLNLKII